MTTRPQNIASIEKKTKKDWSDWVEQLNKKHAKDLPHSEIVAIVRTLLEKDMKSAEWWAQTISVAYEQHTGKRAPGQRANGLFEVTTSATINQPREAVFINVCSWLDAQSHFRTQQAQNPRIAETKIRSNWRCNLPDGSTFTATVEGGLVKARVVFTHTDIPSSEEAEAWKTHWKQALDLFSNMPA